MNLRTIIPENATMSTLVGGIQWQCQNQWYAKLFNTTSIHWDDLSKDSSAILVKHNNKRNVYRVVLGDITFYVKEYIIGSFFERIKNSCRDMPAKEEFLKLFIAQQRNVSVATPIAWGKNLIGSRGYLITLAVDSSMTLQDILSDKTKPEMIDVALAASAKLVAASHCGGVLHRDLHSGNILVSLNTQNATLIDIRGAKVTHRSGHASADPYGVHRIKNLSYLIADIRHNITITQLMQFTNHYLVSLNLLTQLDVNQIEKYFKSVTKAADDRDHKLWVKRARRAKRNSEFAKYFKLHGQWYCTATLKSSFPNDNYIAANHHFTIDDFRRTLIQPTTLLDGGDTLCNNDQIHEVAKTIVIGDVSLDVVIKKYKQSLGIKWFLRLLGRSYAKYEWLSATNLHRRRIPTPWPICAIERRSYFLIKESILITEPKNRNVTVAAFLSNHPFVEKTYKRHLFFSQLGTVLGDFRYKGMIHKDCSASNITVHFNNNGAYYFVFIDLLAVSSMHFKNEKYGHDALISFMTSLLSFGPQMTSTDIIRLIKAYLIASNDFNNNDRITQKAFIKRVRRQVLVLVKKHQMVTQHRLQFDENTKTVSCNEYRNILIIKPSALGDVVRCIPLLNALKERYPNAKVSWLVRTDCAIILSGLTRLDEIIEFDRKLFSKLGRSFVATKRFIFFLKQLKSNQYDLVLDFQGLFRSGFFSWITGAPVKIGFNDAREMATYFYTHKVISQDDEHIVDAMWRFGYLLDFVSYDKDFTIDFTHAHELQAKTILENNNLEANQYIVLLIGGTAASKRWPVEMFSALAKRLSDVNKISIVLIGAGDTETALATTFMSNCQSNVSSNLLVNLVNQTSIPEAALIMKQSLLVCGNDSGPLHIADSFDLPLISIYGPTNPKVVGPYRHMNTVLVSGNNQIRAQRYSQHEAHKIVNINVDDVYNTVINQLGITHEKADDDC